MNRNGRLSSIFRGNGILPVYTALFAIAFSGPLIGLLKYVLHPDHSKYNSHIVFIPLVTGYLLYAKREQIRENKQFSVLYGIPVILAGLLLYWGGSNAEYRLNETDTLSLKTLSVVVCWIGGFLLLYGPQSFRIALFPLLFLLFLVPLPTFLMKKALLILQAASAEVSYRLFQLTGIPIAREGIVFYLPGVSIEIAEACSGMRASLTLLIMSVLAGHLFLQHAWRKGVLVLSTFPITILGNGLRIVGLTLLAMYFDMSFLDSKSLPHMRGGLFFFLVDLWVLGGVAAVLIRHENNNGRKGIPFQSL
jgi:exosortase